MRIVHKFFNTSLEVLLLLALVPKMLDLTLLSHPLLFHLVFLTARFDADLPAKRLDLCEDARAIVKHWNATILGLGIDRRVLLLWNTVLLKQSWASR